MTFSTLAQILLVNGEIFAPVVGIVITSDRNILAPGLDQFSPVTKSFVPGLEKYRHHICDNNLRI